PVLASSAGFPPTADAAYATPARQGRRQYHKPRVAAVLLLPQLQAVLVGAAARAPVQRALPRARLGAAAPRRSRRRVLEKVGHTGHVEYPPAPVAGTPYGLPVPRVRAPVRYVVLADEAR
ncbi:unnamed protein product, partial [Ectocarpus sp. 12 AP-2014]